MLPGMWQIIFSLGVFSSCRFLPRPMIAAGLWYLLTGLVALRSPTTARFLPGRWAFRTARANSWWPQFCSSIRGKVKMKAKNPCPARTGSEGRFAYEGLDRVIHERARLSVLTSLDHQSQRTDLWRSEAVVLSH